MDEKFSEDLLSAYFDGEVSPEERAQVESRLQGDPAARRQLEEIRRLSGLMQDLQGAPAPAEFRAAVMQSIEREMLLGPPAPPATSVTGSRRAARWLYGSSAFATAALLLIAVAYYSRTPQGGDIAERTAPVAARHEGASPLEVVRRDAAAASKTAGIEEMARTLPNVVDSPSNAAAPASEPAPSDGRPSAARIRTVESRPQLAFGKDLRDAEVGQVVQALEHVEGNVSVVTLTVVDRMEGLKGFQSLLTRNRITPQVDQGFAKDTPAKNDADAADTGAGSPGDLVCVYVEAPSEQLAAVIEQLRSEMQFRELRVDEPLALAALDQRSGNQILGDGIAMDAKLSRRMTTEKKGKTSNEKSEAESNNRPGRAESSKEKAAAPAETSTFDSPADKDGDAVGTLAKKTSRDDAAASGEIAVARQMQLMLPQSALSEASDDSAKLDQLAAGTSVSGSRRAIVAQRPQQYLFGAMKAGSREVSGAKQRSAVPVQVLFVLIDEKIGPRAPIKLPSTAPPAAPKKVRNNSGKDKNDGAAS